MAATYTIFTDQSILEDGSAWNKDTLETDVKKGVIIEANSIKDLAKKIKLPIENLKQTINLWNLNAKDGLDKEFGRKTGIKPLLGKKYYAMKNKATNLGSIGGLKINVDCQVIDNFGNVIPGLYAAGLNAGSWIGGYYPGSGTAVSGIIHQDRKAAKHMANITE